MALNRTSLACIALALAAPSLALAQSNDSSVFIGQDGRDNAAAIAQNGDTNQAGSDAVPMRQQGLYNDISILQSGLSNSIGLTAPGVFQLGEFTTATTHNSIDIEQRTNDNVVGSVVQRALGAVPHGANALVVRQAIGEANVLNSVNQTQEAGEARQEAMVEQFGLRNVVDRVEQFANSVDRLEQNYIRITMEGNFNGRLSLEGYAAIPDTADSSILQQAESEDSKANGNIADLLIYGDDNRFGIRQGGRLNTTGLLTLSGDANQIGLRQDGTENDISVAAIDGDGNNIGVDQYGTNVVTLDLIGQSGSNGVLVRQQGTNRLSAQIEGNRNTITGDQDYDAGLGGQNEATVGVTGSDNAAHLAQRGSNLFVLGVTGDQNNAAGLLSPEARALGLEAGYFTQTGSGNAATMTVEGDRNLFATSQTGLANIFFLDVQGNDNEAALLQASSGNTASVRQRGSENVALIRQ
ncbi:hypothetical protein [Oceaniglobus roseus]|uniref:hypothetical protein n=1 Tax=Oceaniglobus roseus TaxID=1737570 RepID=UPI000C7F29CB|nr:hypothetical protein [Kandeliimicrobium roseum]